MNLNGVFTADILTWVVLPVLIFLAGVIYVTLGTLRIIFVSRGRRRLSPLLGFFEVAIWLVAISQIITNVNNIAAYIAYAFGFAVGNYIGILLEEKMALGNLVIRIILTNNDEELKNNLAMEGFGVTSVDGHGVHNEVKIIYTVIRRKDLNKVAEIINKSHSSVFYSVEDARSVAKGVFPIG